MSTTYQKAFDLEDDQLLSDSEKVMWQEEFSFPVKAMSIEEINEKYTKGEQRIVTESNRERLPNFVQALDKSEYMELRPFYQRRSRWGVEHQSKLIESFIINVPVPPIFLYERDFNSYEVMDGQQRITAIRDFYRNRFALKGLDLWPELNGMKYDDLPQKVKSGIDRRSISSIVLLKESAPADEEAMLIRQLVFERLNTGGVKLEHQEVRNCLYKSKFNDLLYDLAKISEFRKVWNLPEYCNEEDDILKSLEIHTDKFYQKMEDTEMVLRFFALRHANHYTKGMRGFLDIYMLRATKFDERDIECLRKLYEETLILAYSIYADLLYRAYDPTSNTWSKNPSKAFHDAVMVALSSFIDKKEELINKKENIIDETRKLFISYQDGELTGRGNSKSDIINRINIVKNMISKSL